MNNKGQTIFFTFMIAITLIVLALALALPVRQAVDDARTGTNGMDCNNESISSFDRGACLVADMTIFHFIGGLIFLAGSVVAAKVVIG